MPLDEATHQLAFLLERDLRRLSERERARSERGEEVRFDSSARIATWESKRGEVIGRWYAENIASYQIRDRMLRWSWAGLPSLSMPSHAEAIAREGQSRGAAQLSMSVVGDLDEAEAFTLARLGVLVARAEGMQVRRTETEVTFVGLFDAPTPAQAEPAPDARYSVPPPSMPAGVGSLPPPRAGGATYRSFPPIRDAFGPSARARTSDAKIREPTRSVFVPVAMAVLAALTRRAPGFQQGLFILNVQGEPEKLRLLVVLVAVDAAGVLRPLDPPGELVDIAARMVDADRKDGNGAWRKLIARITPKPDGGATLAVDVI